MKINNKLKKEASSQVNNLDKDNKKENRIALEGKSHFINQDGATYYEDSVKGIVKGWKQIGDYLYYFSPIGGKCINTEFSQLAKEFIGLEKMEK